MASGLRKFIAVFKNQWPDNEVRDYCVSIIEHIAMTKNSQLEMMSFNTIANILDQDTVTKEVVKAVSILSSCSDPVLKMYFMVFVDDKEYELDLEEINEAERNNELCNPETGYSIDNWEEKVAPFFKPTKHILELKRENA